MTAPGPGDPGLTAAQVVVAPTAIEGGAAGAKERLAGRRVPVPTGLLDRARALGAEVEEGESARTEAGRDWWPLAIGWATDGLVPARPGAVVRPSTAQQVAGVLAACSEARVPVTAAAGRSGVCGGAVPVFGGISLDCTGLTGPVDVDEESLVAEVPAGTYGRRLEETLRSTGGGFTLGHWPQSIDLSTVGGWVACRSAGQYSTRYGKIEDMVAGLEVALADGRLVRTGGQGPRSATGPTLTHLFTGSEGVLGVVTRAWLRVHPSPAAEGRRALGFASFPEGLEACRRIMRRGATPAVLRLYDRTESERSFGRGDCCVLVVLDEADPALLGATLRVVDEECTPSEALDEGLVGQWLERRNDVSALEPLWRAGIVVDTAEVAGRWRVLGGLAADVVAALQALDGTIAASVHLSHAYPDGACLYFTFAGRPATATAAAAAAAAAAATATATERYYRSAWDALTTVVMAGGAAISHHHGIGLNRGRFLAPSLGAAHAVLADVKRSLDPAGILNPGKLGLPTTFGEVPWP